MHIIPLLLALATGQIDVRLTDPSGAVVHCVSVQSVGYAVSGRVLTIDCEKLYSSGFED